MSKKLIKPQDLERMFDRVERVQKKSMPFWLVIYHILAMSSFLYVTLDLITNK